MNEKIKLLAEQAGLIADQDTKEGWQEYINDVEKFAELIVVECVDIINHRADTSADYLDSVKANEHARQVQRDCADTIKRMFGIEE